MAYKDDDISHRIPDYCNNRLNAEEKADFESLLRDDGELLAECRDFQDVRKLYRRIDPAEPSPSEAIFAQISRKVGAQQMENKAPARTSPTAEFLRALGQRIRESMAVPWMLAAAQAVVIVLLLVPAPGKNTYSTLSTTEMAKHAEKAGINVVFRPDAPESVIRSLLHAVRGSIVGGPSREGRYVIEIADPGDLGEAVQTLKKSEIVVFAEPMN